MIFSGDDTSMGSSSDLSKVHPNATPYRHPDFCFGDGNIAVLTGGCYFLVHQGLLSRHSRPLLIAMRALGASSTRYIEGRPVLELQDMVYEMLLFLRALYDGVSDIRYTAKAFQTVAALLRLSTKYEVSHLRKELLRGLTAAWPPTLTQWDLRESIATNVHGIYEPRKTIPHPIAVINLAHAIQAFELLPSAFYDLSRSSPSHAAAGYQSPDGPETQLLPHHDLLSLLKGREHASRFLSTFIVNHMEGRAPATTCAYQKQEDSSRRRTCQAAFEAITFEILSDANGVVCHRSSDPLFAIMDAELMQSRNGLPGPQSPVSPPCGHCRSEFGVVVDAAREEFWSMLPVWFGISLPTWA